jgi:hypothetical protein
MLFVALRVKRQTSIDLAEPAPPLQISKNRSRLTFGECLANANDAMRRLVTEAA